jgi:hypothetical protein
MFIQEYEALTEEERDELLEEHKKIKETENACRRPSAQGRAQDFANTCHSIQLLV